MRGSRGSLRLSNRGPADRRRGRAAGRRSADRGRLDHPRQERPRRPARDRPRGNRRGSAAMPRDRRSPLATATGLRVRRGDGRPSQARPPAPRRFSASRRGPPAGWHYRSAAPAPLRPRRGGAGPARRRAPAPTPSIGILSSSPGRMGRDRLRAAPGPPWQTTTRARAGRRRSHADRSNRDGAGSEANCHEAGPRR
jgi:hypothetical protein